MKLRVEMTQEEMCEAIQDYVDEKVARTCDGRPRVKFVSQPEGNKNLFHLETHFEAGSRLSG